jgi:F420-dependent oxidoreductase-like protein
MKLGLTLTSGAQVALPMDLIRRAEALGFDSVWTSEAYGADAVTPATWVLAQTTRIKAGTAIMQMPARSPAATAMTAATLAQLSGGRFILGVGPSGPQVAEGWHGVAYGKPLARTREYVQIIRQIWAREAPLSFRGEHYHIPYDGPDATGQGRPLRSILHTDPRIPIYTASISPGGLRVAGEVADGVFPIWMSPERSELVVGPIEEGLKLSGSGRKLSDFAVCPMVTVALGDDLERCRKPSRAMLALYIGGMGSREKNFYNDYASRMGYAEEARRIQDLYLQGRRDDAMAAVPERLIDEVALVGPRKRILDRLEVWKDAARKGHVHTLTLSTNQPEVLELLASAAAG